MHEDCMMDQDESQLLTKTLNQSSSSRLPHVTITLLTHLLPLPSSATPLLLLRKLPSYQQHLFYLSPYSVHSPVALCYHNPSYASITTTILTLSLPPPPSATLLNSNLISLPPSTPPLHTIHWKP
ncbi:unnamed protein product [Lactuca virosa]|uniref:Uncharacterized protein n=1 Tax=Lactuca virosa TaxID=75947 RepID=A0AAU9P559_9ASTR|nr:unnamed protein product [Lactuca virosa]